VLGDVVVVLGDVVVVLGDVVVVLGDVVVVLGDVVVVLGGVEVEVEVTGAVVVLAVLDDVDVDVDASAIVVDVLEVWRLFDTSLFQRSYNQGFSAATESLNTPDSSACVSTALSATDSRVVANTSAIAATPGQRDNGRSNGGNCKATWAE